LVVGPQEAEKGGAREMSMMDVERKEELKKINQISITCTRVYVTMCICVEELGNNSMVPNSKNSKSDGHGARSMHDALHIDMHVRCAVSPAPQTYDIMTKTTQHISGTETHVPGAETTTHIASTATSDCSSNTLATHTTVTDIARHSPMPPLSHPPGAGTATHIADTITLAADTATGNSTATYGAKTTHQHQMY
jgi:hypothetical protein